MPRAQAFLESLKAFTGHPGWGVGHPGGTGVGSRVWDPSQFGFFET